MSFFTGSSGFTITGGNFTSISLPTQDAGRFYLHFKPCYRVILTVLNTAGAKQAMEKRKDRDSCESNDDLRRCRSTDGLMVRQQTIVSFCHDHALVVGRKGRRSRPA